VTQSVDDWAWTQLAGQKVSLSVLFFSIETSKKMPSWNTASEVHDATSFSVENVPTTVRKIIESKCHKY